MAGRKTRKQLVGRQEDIERGEREAEYAELEAELHTAQQTGSDEAKANPDIDPADRLDELD